VKTKPFKPAKVKLTDEQYLLLEGSAAQFKYIRKGKFWVQDMETIRRLAKAKSKAQKFCIEVLTPWGEKRWYISKTGFTDSRKNALEFAYGFDDPVVQLKKWQGITQLPIQIK
jgi:hypothetical protein